MIISSFWESGSDGLRGERDMLQYPFGLNGLVFKTSNPAELYDALKSKGLPVRQPVSLSRPVALASGMKEARFDTVRFEPGVLGATRLYFCDHKTPELVWQVPHRPHPNGVADIAGTVIASGDPGRSSRVFSIMYGSSSLTEISGGLRFNAASCSIEFLHVSRLADRFGAAAVGRANDTSEDYMAAVLLKTESLQMVRDSLEKGGIAWIERGTGSIVVGSGDALGAILEFVADGAR